MLNNLRGGGRHKAAIWWILIIVTVFTFVIGFNFIGGVGVDPLAGNRTGVAGLVDGQKVPLADYQRAVAEAKMQYRQRFGAEPIDRDLKAVEQQAWRNLVTQRLFVREAKQAGIQVTDNEVVDGVRRIPPPEVQAAPEFVKDGQFDFERYQQLLADPGMNWAPYEARMRAEILPINKLQERLLSSIKLTEPELVQSFHERYDRYSASLLQVPPADTGSSKGDDATLQRIYEKYKDRLVSGARTQAEVLTVPREYSEDEIASAMALTTSYYERWKAGEPFDQLARDNSEGPNADKGGVIDRWFNPMELGVPLGEMVAARRPGDVIPPYREGGQVFLVHILDPARDSLAMNPPYPAAVKIAQLMVKIRLSDESLRKQYNKVKAIRDQAAKLGEGGLSKAATGAQLTTLNTGFFNDQNPPQMLFQAPDAAEWATSHAKGAVSPVFVGSDEFHVVQVIQQYAAGQAPARKDVTEQVKQIADVDARVELAKPRADRIAEALKSGISLESAALAEALTVAPITMTRQQPDPRLASAPEVLGAIYAGKPGQVVGPIRTPSGWFFARIDGLNVEADSLLTDTVKGQITTDLLTRRQQGFFQGFFTRLRANADIKDQRN